MASIVPDIISARVGAEQYDKEATDIVFSLPELSLDEQTKMLFDSVASAGNEITLEAAKQSIGYAWRTF